MPDMTEAYDWRGRSVVDRDGEKIGKIDEIYVDQQNDQPEWAVVNTGLFGTKSSFVPLAGASTAGEDVRVNVAKDQVKDAPRIEPDGDLSEDQERELFQHYGVEYTEAGSVTAQPQSPATGEGGGDAMTRSEEELRVGTRRREAGRVRLRKYVVTENVTRKVPVQREEVRLEREPITEGNVDAATSGPEISEAEHEVTLHAEEPVVEKRTVPKERVRLAKDTVTDEETVSEEVRKEQIEHEGDLDR